MKTTERRERVGPLALSMTSSRDASGHYGWPHPWTHRGKGSKDTRQDCVYLKVTLAISNAGNSSMPSWEPTGNKYKVGDQKTHLTQFNSMNHQWDWNLHVLTKLSGYCLAISIAGNIGIKLAISRRNTPQILNIEISFQPLSVVEARHNASWTDFRHCTWTGCPSLPSPVVPIFGK